MVMVVAVAVVQLCYTLSWGWKIASTWTCDLWLSVCLSYPQVQQMIVIIIIIMACYYRYKSMVNMGSWVDIPPFHVYRKYRIYDNNNNSTIVIVIIIISSKTTTSRFYSHSHWIERHSFHWIILLSVHSFVGCIITRIKHNNPTHPIYHAFHSCFNYTDDAAGVRWKLFHATEIRLINYNTEYRSCCYLFNKQFCTRDIIAIIILLLLALFPPADNNCELVPDEWWKWRWRCGIDGVR